MLDAASITQVVHAVVLNIRTTKKEIIELPVGKLTAVHGFLIRPRTRIQQELSPGYPITQVFLEVWQQPQEHEEIPKLIFSNWVVRDVPLAHMEYQIFITGCTEKIA